MSSLKAAEKRKNSDDVQIVSVGSSSSNSTNTAATKQNLTSSSSSSTSASSSSLPKKLPTLPQQLTQTQRKKITTLIATKSSSTSGSSTLIDEDGTRFESRCENPDCSAPTLISLVPTKPTPQFIQNPYVVQNPVLVNGFTTVFQIDGHAAKVTEVKSTISGKKQFQTISPIYRIIPNTHAHIVNYVIVDAHGETLQKIKDNDPATMKKLLESQVNSADQLLKKLMGLKKVEGKIVRPPMVVDGSVEQSTPVPPSTATGSTSKSDSIPTAPVLPIQISKQNPKVQIPAQKTPEISVQKISQKNTVQTTKQQVSVQLPSSVSLQPGTAKSTNGAASLTGKAKSNVIFLEPRLSPRKESAIISTNQTTKITVAPTTSTVIPITSLKTSSGTSLPINISTGTPSTLIPTAILPGSFALSRKVSTTSLLPTVPKSPTPDSLIPVEVQTTKTSLPSSSATPFSVSMLQNTAGANPVSNSDPNPANLNALERMQAELNELRETVKQLQQKRPTTDDEDQNNSKKMKLP